jgi:plastocyanin
MTDETSDSGSVAIEPAHAAAPVSFWHRPNVERYLSPLIMPIVVVVGLVVYVLNLSRVFLSAHGHTNVVVGSVVTVAILLGATVLSNSSRLRTQTIALMTAGFLLVVFSAGWLVLGHSQVKGVSNAALGDKGKYTGTIGITAGPGGRLAFAPPSLSATTGIYLVTLTDGVDTQHTLNFDQTDTLWGSGLVVNKAGEKLSSRIFFGTAGDYTYYCAVPGHRSGGMQGVIHVTGPTVTEAQADASAKNTAT